MKKILIIFLMMLLCSTYSHAEKILLVTGEWAPYTSQEIEGYGFITEIISETLKDMGMTPEYEFRKWKRCYSLVKRNKVWAAFPYSYTEERAKEVFYSDTVGESTTKFFFYNKGEKVFKYEDLADLKAYKISGVKGYFYEEAFEKAGLNISYTSDETSALKRLAAGRVELMPMNELVGWALIKKVFPDDVSKFGTLEKPYSVAELKLIVSQKYPDSENLLKRFNESLKKVKTGERYRIILEKYGLGK